MVAAAPAPELLMALARSSKELPVGVLVVRVHRPIHGVDDGQGYHDTQGDDAQGQDPALELMLPVVGSVTVGSVLGLMVVVDDPMSSTSIS